MFQVQECCSVGAIRRLLSQTAALVRLLLKSATVNCQLQWEQGLIPNDYVCKIRHALIFVCILNWWFLPYGTVSLKEKPPYEFSLSRSEIHIALYGLVYAQWVFHCIVTDYTENVLKLIRYMVLEEMYSQNLFFLIWQWQLINNFRIELLNRILVNSASSQEFTLNLSSLFDFYLWQNYYISASDSFAQMFKVTFKSRRKMKASNISKLQAY